MRDEIDRISEDFRDSEIWWGDIPSDSVDENCSYCGEKINDFKRVSFIIDNAHGIEHYEYHVNCVKSRFK
jgi:hypothetical protein